MALTTIKALSAATAKAVSDYTAAATRTNAQRGKLLDMLHADGVTSDMLAAPAKGEDRAFYDSAKAAVVAGFTPQVQKLLKADAKSLKPAQKIDRKYWQQQIGSRMSDLKSGLAKREAAIAAAEAAESGEDADKPTATWEAKTRAALATLVKQAQGKEATTIKDLAAFIADLNSAIARIPA